MDGRNFEAKRGVSLPLMLTVMVLLAGLGVSMLTLVGAQRQLSRSDADRRACLLLRSSIESLLREQIRAATTQPNHIWASQPGLLSTFNQQGKLSNLYKLYSSSQMQTAGGSEALADWESRDAPANWAHYPATFVNLNAPLKGRYPILDPAAQGRVEGFAYDSERGVVMPVMWLYLLRDGQIVAPQTMDGNKQQVQVAGATEENPIVGRIAFWTDDESCRLNLNTAAGGAFWEAPVTATTPDRPLGTHAPIEHEFQRHPGHPARVELATVFPELLNQQPPYRDQILTLAPGYNPGGSNEGTTKTYGQRRLAPIGSGLAMAWRREADWALALAQSSAATMDPAVVAQRGFFVTTDSRASNLNLMGRPRISLWPLDASPSRRLQDEQQFDLLSRLPGTTPSSFSFHRSNPLADNEATGIEQNADLLAYLRQMTEFDPPGYAGGSLSGKFGGRDRDYILAGIVDYIRTIQSARPQDQATGWPPSLTPSTGAGVGQILPTGWLVGSEVVRGTGRVPTISEVALHFYGTETDPSTGNTTKMTAVLLLELQFPGQGYPALQPDIAITLQTDPTKTPQVNSVPLVLSGSGTTPPSATNHLPVDRAEPAWPKGERLESGSLSWVATMHGKERANPDTRKVYPFIFEGLDVSTDPGFPTQFTFTGGELLFTLSVPLEDGTLKPYQDLVIAFPTPSSSTNLAGRWFIPPMDLALDVDGDQVISFAERYGVASRAHPDFFAGDLVRSMEGRRDLRILMRQRFVDPSFFARGQVGYDEVAIPHVSSLLRTAQEYYTPALTGGWVEDASYGAAAIPNLPHNLTPLLGDWENGQGNLPDGAWSRKSDEGFAGGRTDKPYLDPTQGLVSTSHPLNFTARQVASPVVLGALNRGVGKDWETLAFCPHPAAGSAHPGLADPPDYLWLDLFTIPIREPFPLTDVSSVQGRINLNQRLVPFGYINRTSALRAVLRAVALTAIPPEAAAIYKTDSSDDTYRLAVDLDATISRWQSRWDRGEVFRSETEICGEYLVPEAAGGTNPETWWQGYALTGDNARESPYHHLLTLLTTRSHTYRTFYRVEKLQQPASAPADMWTEGIGQVRARLAGSLRFSRYLDPADSRLAGLDVTQNSLEPYFRVWVEELEEH